MSSHAEWANARDEAYRHYLSFDRGGFRDYVLDLAVRRRTSRVPLPPNAYLSLDELTPERIVRVLTIAERNGFAFAVPELLGIVEERD
jgi:hypothetical protein